MTWSTPSARRNEVCTEARVAPRHISAHALASVGERSLAQQIVKEQLSKHLMPSGLGSFDICVRHVATARLGTFRHILFPPRASTGGVAKSCSRPLLQPPAVLCTARPRTRRH